MRYFTSLFLFFALLLVTAGGCDQVDDITGGGIDKPGISYSETSFDAEFFQAGNSVTPSIDWNGEQGSVALGTTLAGLSINSTTGKLYWDETLPAGTHNIDVIVSNSEGQVVVPVTIDNLLQGSFVGVYDDTYYYAFDLMADGTLTLEASSKTNPETANGTWTLIDRKITAIYVYTNTGATFSFKGTIAQTTSKATIAGKWYSGDSFTGADEGGTFTTELK